MERAASFGVHVLCEKPLSVTPDECVSMIEQARRNNIKLMTAYRLYLDEANNDVLKIINQNEIGEVKIFNSSYFVEVKDPHNIRLETVNKGGGPLHDIGIYCINAARRIFKSLPVQVFAFATNSKDTKFIHVDENICCTLKFPDNKMANFSISFSGYPVSDFEILGTNGRLRLENAYSYNRPKNLIIFKNNKSHKMTYPKYDQFANELIHFSHSIINNSYPAPSGEEGLLDIKIIEALLLSLDLGTPVDTTKINKTTGQHPQTFKN
jgi:glucose-fructose oxidoreductase